MIRSGEAGNPVERDYARGSRLLLIWGPPIALIFLGSGLGSSGALTFAEAGVLLVVGTAWLGVTCLANALRCGRAHCWIDGVLLPGLAVVGALNIGSLVTLPWRSFVGILLAIVIASFVVECVTGPYLGKGRA